MRGEILFEKMTHISDEYIAEAALVPAVGAPRRGRVTDRFASLSNALNSGWGVACICFAVAIAAIIGMVAWGRMGEPVEPGPGSDPAVRFTFSYEMTDASGLPITGKVAPGSTITVDTGLINRGHAFEYEGSSSEFCPYAKFVWRGDDSVTISGLIAHTSDIGTFTVENGEEGRGVYFFTIPINAREGMYDLVLSYEGVQQVYSGVLTVGEADTFAEVVTIVENGSHTGTEAPSPDPLSFSYEQMNSPTEYAAWRAGDTIQVKVSVTNHGEPFDHTGSSGDFIPYAILSLTPVDGPKRIITGTTALPDDHGTFTVSTGQTGTAIYSFELPADTPPGQLKLTMGYGDQGTDTYSLGGVSNASYTMEEAIAFASTQLVEHSPGLDLSDHVPMCVDSLPIGDVYLVKFRYQYYGYTVGNGTAIHVSLTADKQLSDITVKDEYAAYTEALTEDMFLSAVDSIFQGVMDIDPSIQSTEAIQSLLYFETDDEDWLCLCMEYIGPPIYDENGNSLSGCGDHEHYFFKEQLCKQP